MVFGESAGYARSRQGVHWLLLGGTAKEPRGQRSFPKRGARLVLGITMSLHHMVALTAGSMD